MKDEVVVAAASWPSGTSTSRCNLFSGQPSAWAGTGRRENTALRHAWRRYRPAHRVACRRWESCAALGAPEAGEHVCANRCALRTASRAPKNAPPWDLASSLACRSKIVAHSVAGCLAKLPRPASPKACQDWTIARASVGSRPRSCSLLKLAIAQSRLAAGNLTSQYPGRPAGHARDHAIPEASV